MKRNLDISTILKPLSECPHQAYLSNALQVADVLEWILGQVGKSEIWQTSFSISEEFLRRLFFIEKSGNITAFNLVLDHKATQQDPQIVGFHHPDDEAHISRRQPLQNPVGKSGKWRASQCCHLAKSHARQPLRVYFHLHRSRHLPCPSLLCHGSHHKPLRPPH